ncbi:hypothetical protein T069G_09312 [Trichoderma breve]|uniref:BZIP domain-containing protein n=1 Tax=Trichoderma breve TaxID=2034170 RepID=A0A9W9B539_9HYPO|nr:hypothetical protein T069G_09312 [Trichoderma breve]KAJ4855944.1 hypothetical protein T069G_09312 [Trichoderma breve]
MRNDDDEWRGTTDPSVRRRVQNRLNQRAYRQRRQMLGILDKPPKKATRKPVSQHLNHADKRRPGSVPTGAESLSCRRQAEDKSHVTGRLEARHRKFDDKQYASSSASVDPSLWYTNPAAVVVMFQELKLGRHAERSPSNDHLLGIMQFNVMRAFGTLSSIIGLSSDNLIDDGALSPFSSYTYSAHNIPHFRLPKSLAPTALQRSIPHHPWIDILPYPQMRDNLLLLESGVSTTMEKRQYDADSLCHWMVGLDTCQKESGLILWGDPWDLASWEVTAEFLNEWGWTLEGCVDLFRSTDYWRARRGERPLFRMGH